MIQSKESRWAFAAKVGVCILSSAPGCSAERSPAKAPLITTCEAVGGADPHRTLLEAKNIESVERFTEEVFVARPSPLKTAAAERQAKTVGVRVFMLPAPGLTAERLQLLANCDRASAERLPLVAHDLRCPFGVKGASTTVNSTGMGFAADVVSDDPDTVQEVLRRAATLSKAIGAEFGEH